MFCMLNTEQNYIRGSREKKSALQNDFKTIIFGASIFLPRLPQMSCGAEFYKHTIHLSKFTTKKLECFDVFYYFLYYCSSESI